MSTDFSRQNLQGKSFRGQDLIAADFSFSDIRGVDFARANLAGANFTGATAGQPRRWMLGLVMGLLLLSSIAGFISAYAGGFIGSTMVANAPEIYGSRIVAASSSLVALLALVVFVLIALRQGLGRAVGIFVISVMAAVAIVVAISEADAFSAVLILQAIALSIAVAGSIVSAFAFSLIKIVAGNRFVYLAFAIGAVTAIPGGLEGASSLSRKSLILDIIALTVAGIVTISLLGLGLYISFCAKDEDDRYAVIHALSMSLSSLGGTRFQGANLTDSAFAGATLKNTDLRGADLTRVSFLNAKGLSQARANQSYLRDRKIRRLVVSGVGQNQDFSYQNLSSINLQGANLAGTSFIGANLSNSNLQNAVLSGAKLARTQLYQANLSGSDVTGAFIEDWGISTNTQLNGIICEHVYMRLPTQDDPDPCRKPDNKQESFNLGDFETFIAPIIKTLDLYQQQNVDPRRIATAYKTVDLFHDEGIDPSASAIALKQLADQYPEAGLEVVALEGRGDEKIRVQARVVGQANRSQLSADYFEKYQKAAALPYGDLKSLLAAITEKDQRIQSLENMVTTAIKSDKFYVETYYDLGKPSEEDQPVKKILILTSNPQNTDRRRLDAEVREIQAGLERAKKRDQFEIIAKWAVRTDDLRRALLDYEPQIVHFSGYGAANEGLAFEDETGAIKLVSTAALASLFEVFKGTVECVFLNACYSAEQTDAISQHIPYVIGMNHEIGDLAAMEFAVGFYDALGAGRSIDDAFKLGCISIDLEGLPESLTPVLKRATLDDAPCD